MLADDVACNFVADAIATLYCYICIADGRPLWHILQPDMLHKWQVLLPYVAAGLATWQWFILFSILRC